MSDFIPNQTSRNLNEEEIKQLNEFLHEEQVAFSELDYEMKRLISKYDVPNAVMIEPTTYVFVDSNSRPIEDKKLSEEEFKKLVKIKMKFDEIASRNRFYISKIRQECGVPFYMVLNENFQWVAPPPPTNERPR